MSRSTIPAGILILSMGTAAGAQAPPAKPVGGEPDFKGMFRKTAAAWQTLDPSKAAPFYAKDATLAFFDLAPLKYAGWDDYAAGAAKVFGGFSSIKISLNDDMRAQRRGNMAWATSTAHIDLVNKDGSKTPLDVRWTIIWEKRGNDWLIVHEHASIPLPEPASPTPTR